MNDIFSTIINFFQTFDSQKFTNSILSILIIFYIILSIFFGFKTYKDSKKRVKDMILVIIFTILVIIFHFFGLGYILYSIIRPKEYIQDQHMLKLEKYFLEYETLGIGKCKVCKHLYFPEHSYCTNCGTLVRTKCSVCDNTIELDWNSCPYCGDKKKSEGKIYTTHNALTYKNIPVQPKGNNNTKTLA